MSRNVLVFTLRRLLQNLEEVDDPFSYDFLCFFFKELRWIVYSIAVELEERGDKESADMLFKIVCQSIYDLEHLFESKVGG